MRSGGTLSASCGSCENQVNLDPAAIARLQDLRALALSLESQGDLLVNYWTLFAEREITRAGLARWLRVVSVDVRGREVGIVLRMEEK